MKKLPLFLMRLSAALFVVQLASVVHAADEIGFIEEFALAEDRELALEQLIPGTEDFYYYHALHHQNEGSYEEVEKLLPAWIKRHGETRRVWEIRHRQALLRYSDDPKATLAHLKKHLKLSFNHQKEVLRKKPNLPTKLDPTKISRAAYIQQALKRHKNMGGFHDSAFRWVGNEKLKLEPVRRRDLLKRLTTPDYPGLVGLISTDLKSKESRGFGEFAIHRQLLPAQLKELLKLQPKLINNTNYVNAVVSKLRPSADIDWQIDSKERDAYLRRVWDFVKTLEPSFNSLKAHALYRVLANNLENGVYDKTLFMAYLRLPRQGGYINPKYLEDADRQRHRANLGQDFSSVTGCATVGNDESLVRAHLMHFLVEEKSFEPYAKYIRDTWLKPVSAPTKIQNGGGDQERWSSLLDPWTYQALKDRVDLEFERTNPKTFAPEDPVELAIHVKNVETLIVKVYEINALNYYVANGREVNTDLQLDGLVANEKTTHKYEESPLRRIKRTFRFDSLKDRRGTWVIEFIGNGRSSRALVRKGKLQYLTQPSAAGTLFTVLDAANKPVEEPAVWLGGREYAPNKDGFIVVPFSNNPGRVPVILTDGEFASLERFEHPAENYRLSAGFHVDRESLLPRKEVEVAIRPALSLNGAPVALSLLENVRLSVTSVDLDGVSTTAEAGDFKVLPDRESTWRFTVPERLQTLQFNLNAEVKNLAKGETQNLSASASFTLNEMDTRDVIDDHRLAKIDGEFVVEVFGKSGEARADRAVAFEFHHPDFKNSIGLSLQTNAEGRIYLGELEGISAVHATGPNGQGHRWSLPRDHHSLPASVHGKAGGTVSIPYMTGGKPSRESFALYELRGGTFFEDKFASITVADGFLTIADLAAGDYQLHLKELRAIIAVRITEGEPVVGYLVSDHRHLQISNPKPLQIRSLASEGKKVRITLANANPLTRVHVAAVRYLPDYRMDANLGGFPAPEPYVIGRAHSNSVFLSGRDIGDEYRYILARQLSPIFPGVMLARPGLLLNPWELRTTETAIDTAKEGQTWSRSAEDKASKRAREAKTRQAGGRKAAQGRGAHSFTSLDFFHNAATVAYNLVPAKDGTITLDLEDIGDRQHLHVLAIDPRNTAYREFSVADRSPVVRDTRLRNGIDPKGHYAEERNVTVAAKGDKLKIGDVRTAKVESYDSLKDVYTLFTTLSGDATLAEFRFVIDWPTLTDKVKRERYSKYACHELNFFILRRDPEFFKAVVLPYLRNKKDKTFLDHYLTGADLSGYLEPWRYGRLNIVERILLSQTLGGDESKATARHVKDRYDLLPLDQERANHLFETALKGRAMSAEEGELAAGFGEAVEALMEDQERDFTRLKEAAKFSDGVVAAAPQTAAVTGGVLAVEKEVEKLARLEQKTKKLRSALKVEERLEERAQELADAIDFDVDENMPEPGFAYLGPRDKDLRERARQFYRKLEKTKEWAENNYYHRPIEEQIADLVTVNAFWRDYAAWDGKRTFLSSNFAEAHRNFSEIMFALSVLDLPFEDSKHETASDDATLTITAGGPAIFFRREIVSAPISDQKTPILLSQNFFRHGDRYQHVDNEKVDKFVTEEFLAGTVYGCQVVVTNPTSSNQKLDLLVQIPQFAVPVMTSKYTRSRHLVLAPYNTTQVEYHFYFPLSDEKGEPFPQFPVHVGKQEKIVAWAEPFSFNVVDELSSIDKASWDYISQFGTEAEVFSFLEQNNIDRIDLNRIAWRMKDIDFFKKAIALVEARHVYNNTLYSYGIYHNDLNPMRQFLQHADGFIDQTGEAIDCELVSIDPVLRHRYQHLEYSPLVNARAHQLGKERKILNNYFRAQYLRLMKVLSYRKALTDEDNLAVTYYMLLQDRIEEGLAFLGKVDADKLPTQIQHDYLGCYVAFYEADPARARAIAANYAEHPVDRWRNLFARVVSQVDEIEGSAVVVEDPEDREQKQDQLAATEPSFDFKVENKEVEVAFRNLSEVTVNYYRMDLEFLFSTNPFVSSDSSRFSIVRPNLTKVVKLAKGKEAHQFALPKEFHGSNVLVEIVAAGRKKAHAYYANDLKVNLVENYGRIEIGDAQSGKPLSKVYVKVYAQTPSGVKFYKDGYTDLRGKFDYASLNTDEIEGAGKFAILVMSKDRGATVREANPPTR